MLPDAERFRLIDGPYRPPRCRIGGELTCVIRGKFRVDTMSDGLIQWPMTRGRKGGNPSMILCGDLAKAVERESTAAIQHWWGLKSNTVWTWRKALGVEQNNAVTRKLRSKWWADSVGEATRPGREATFHSPERAAKIAAAKRGKPRPKHVIEAMNAARLAKPVSDDTRRRMSEAQRRRGAYPPAAGRPFTAKEDALLGTMADKDVAAKLGRGVGTITGRRIRLGIESYRRRTRGW